MADYINREDAIRKLNAEGYTKNMRIHKRILDIPAADVRENVTAKWEERIVEDSNPLFRRRFYCSACEKWQTYGKTSFCPNCGADMCGGEKDG